MSRQADGKAGRSEEWGTPPDFFNRLVERFGAFDLDPCATRQNAKAPAYFTRQTNGLRQEWWGNVFANPPYGRGLGDWFAKAAAESVREDCQVVGLVPANNTDTSFWHKWVLDRGAHEVLFVRRRIHFLLDGVPQKRNAISSAVIVWRPGRPPRHPKIGTMEAR